MVIYSYNINTPLPLVLNILFDKFCIFHCETCLYHDHAVSWSDKIFFKIFLRGKLINCIKLYFNASSVGKPSAMDSESYQRMSSTDVYDEYDLAPDFQRIYIAGQEISGVNTCNNSPMNI